MRTVAIIPCHDEVQSIARIVQLTSRYVDKVLVVDNMSYDSTGLVAREAGAVVTLCNIKGAGAATRQGISVALLFHDADIIVTLDGDGQHDPDEIPRLLWSILDGKADLVNGSRFLVRGYKAPAIRRFGIAVNTAICNFGANEKVTDSLSGFRALTRQAAEQIPISENGFGFSTEMLIRARFHGLRIVEVPISCIYNSARSDHTLDPVRQELAILKGTVGWLWRTRGICGS